MPLVVAVVAHGLDVLVDDAYAVVEQRDGRVLGVEVVGDGRLGERVTRRVLGDVVDADALGLLGGQRELELDEEHGDHTGRLHVGTAVRLRGDVDDRLVDAHGQVGVLAERVELEQERTLVHRAHLFVERHVGLGGRAARRVPAEEVEVGEDLLELADVRVEELEVDESCCPRRAIVHRLTAAASLVAHLHLERGAQLDVSALLAPEQRAVHLHREPTSRDVVYG